jgi:hypothetical protein
MDNVSPTEWLARARGNEARARTAREALASALRPGQPPVRAHLRIIVRRIGRWLLGQAQKAADERPRAAHMRETRASR